jgi:hypothetical protein
LQKLINVFRRVNFIEIAKAHGSSKNVISA